MKQYISLLLLLLISSCAAKKLAVRNADSLIQYQIEKKIPLYSAQKDKLGKDIDKILSDLKPQIKTLVPLLKDMPIESPEKVENHYVVIDQIYQRIESDFTKLIAANLAVLDEKQQRDFLKIMIADTRVLEDKSEARKKDTFEKNLKILLGSVTDKQKEIIKSYDKYFAQRAASRINGRKNLQANLAKLFEGEMNSEAFVQAFKEYQNERKKDLQITTILKAFIPTLTPEQKLHLKEKFEEAESLIIEFLKTSY